MASTKNKIYDVENNPDHSNPELLRGSDSKPVLEHSVTSHKSHRENDIQRPRRSRTTSDNENKFKNKSKKNSQHGSHTTNNKKKPFLAISWVLFLLLTIGGALFFNWSLSKNSSITSLLKNINLLFPLVIFIILWIFGFFFLLYRTSKKLATIIALIVLLLGNYSLYQVNASVENTKKIFPAIPSNTVIPKSNKDTLKEPFTILFLGVDSEATDGLEKSSSESGNQYRSDTMIIMTINPLTHKADMVTTPRDTFEYDSCSGTTQKLNAFIQGGLKCLTDKFTEMYGVSIDFYVQADFKAVVSIVDSIGGIEMYVPDLTAGYQSWLYTGGSDDDGVSYTRESELREDSIANNNWCDVDSLRNPYAVCFEAPFGIQKIDGEHALALARSRHYDSDYARGIRQIELIKSIGASFGDEGKLTALPQIISTLSQNNSIETNITYDQLQTFALQGDTFINALGGGTDDVETFQVQKMQPLGTDASIGGGSGIELFQESKTAIGNELKMTLGLLNPSPKQNEEYYEILEYPTAKTNG